MPSIVSNLKSIRSSDLLLKLDTETHSITPMDFHDWCDEKGPTLTLIKTDDDKIYGAYNPISFISENIYTEADTAFIFSYIDNNFTMYHIKEPELAIKQSGYEFSPWFGVVNNADLFISYKHPSKSYCNLGNVSYINLIFNHILGVSK